MLEKSKTAGKIEKADADQEEIERDLKLIRGRSTNHDDNDNETSVDTKDLVHSD